MESNIAFSAPIAITFTTYALLMLGIGFYFYRRNETTQDYFLGNRKMGAAVSALSAGASDMSGWLLMGLPGALYVGGLVEAHIAIGLIIGAALNWALVAKRLRIYTSVISDSITIPDFFEARFDDRKHILRWLSAAVILVFFTFYISAGLVGGAKLFEATFALKYDYALSIGTLIIVAYTFFGGYRAVCWTDMIQGLLMLGALVIVAMVMLVKVGGISEAHAYIAHSDSARKSLQEYQKEIPQIRAELRENSQSKILATQMISPLITSLQMTRDSKISVAGVVESSTAGAVDSSSLESRAGNGADSGAQNAESKIPDSGTESSAQVDSTSPQSPASQQDSILQNLAQEPLTASQYAKALESALEAYTTSGDYEALDSLLERIEKQDFSAHNRLAFIGGASLLGIISALAWGLGYFGQPHILVRFMSIKSLRDIKPALIIGVSWMSLSLLAACMVGLLGVAFVNKFDLSLSDPEKIFIVMSQMLFNPWVAGMLLSAILAAIMSTASSQLLVSSATIAEDFYRKIFRKDAPERLAMIVSRVSVVAVSLIAFMLSTDKDSSVLKIVAHAWAGFGASFGSVILLGLFWKNMSRAGAIAGMLAGAIVVIVHRHWLKEWLPIYEIVPGFLGAIVAIVVFSLLFPANKRMKDDFESMLKTSREANI